MNVAQKFRTLWDSSEALKAVLPTEFLMTGTSIRKELPFGVIRENKMDFLSMTNRGPKTYFMHADIELSVASHNAVEVFLNEIPKIFNAENHFQIQDLRTVCQSMEYWKTVFTVSYWEDL
ncbi:MAG: hypothetical protein IJF17_08530 [Thermoguttaceae bacterium]|nr:hypothetical protein [Thermoguttaceae bacterium]MDO4425009.1 hypothetical protein [Planctomycetia bacterium]